MNRNQSSTTSRSGDARPAYLIAATLVAGIIGSLVLPLWVIAMLLLFALIVLQRLVSDQPETVPVVIRRDSRR